MRRNFIELIAVTCFLLSIQAARTTEPNDKDLQAYSAYRDCEKDRKADEPRVKELYNLFREKAQEYLKAVQECQQNDELPTEALEEAKESEDISLKLGDDMKTLKIMAERAGDAFTEKSNRCKELLEIYANATIAQIKKSWDLAIAKGDDNEIQKKSRDHRLQSARYAGHIRNFDRSSKPWLSHLWRWNYEAPATSKCTVPENDINDPAAVLAREKKVLSFQNSELASLRAEIMVMIHNYTPYHNEYCQMTKKLPKLFEDCEQEEKKTRATRKTYYDLSQSKSDKGGDVFNAYKKTKEVEASAKKLRRAAYDHKSKMYDQHMDNFNRGVDIDRKIGKYVKLVNTRDDAKYNVTKLESNRTNANRDKESPDTKSIVQWRNKLEDCKPFNVTGLCVGNYEPIIEIKISPRPVEPEIKVNPLTTTKLGGNVTPSLFAISILLLGIFQIVF